MNDCLLMVFHRFTVLVLEQVLGKNANLKNKADLHESLSFFVFSIF